MSQLPGRVTLAAMLACMVGGVSVVTVGATAVRALGVVVVVVALAVAHQRSLDASREALKEEMRELWSVTGVMVSGRPWPAPGGWALGADAINAAIQEVHARELGTIVELGPGASSVFLHRAVGDQTTIWGIEHDAEYLAKVDELLRHHNISGYTLVHAPLTPMSRGKLVTQWYDPDALSVLPNVIDLLIIDGPPNWSRGSNNRQPALERLRSRLVEGSLILVDDTWRSAERRMVRRWVDDGDAKVVRDHGTFMMLEVL